MDPLSPHPTAHWVRSAVGKGTGSRHAWRVLISQCESRLRVLAEMRMDHHTMRHSQVDDLIQGVWEVATERISEFEDRGPGSLQNWLSGILKNKMREGFRSSKRTPIPFSRLESSFSPDKRFLLEAISRTQVAVDANLQRRETEEAIRVILRSLPSDQTEAVLMRIYEGHTSSEAARLLGIPESTFSKRFRTALRKIRQPLMRALR